MFFFEKKNQKTFRRFGFGASGEVRTEVAKDFVLFFKKAGLALMSGCTVRDQLA
jgi:hypothetical protein